ncbi:MAG: EndoU domain-containing protein [Defluviitaleaceae bacterium]|nr:EndoU domain-containing protein [Defluviitaleaceae bacterium]
MIDDHVSSIVQGLTADLNSPPPRAPMTQEERETIRALIVDALYHEASGHLGRSQFVVEGARVVCTSMEEYQSNSLMRKLTEKERERNLADIAPSQVGGRMVTPMDHQVITAIGFDTAGFSAYGSHQHIPIFNANNETMLDHMDIKFDPVFGAVEGLTAYDQTIISEAVRARRPSDSIGTAHINAVDQLGDLDPCGKCKYSADGKCKPDIEHLMWQDTDKEVRLSGDGSGTETLLQNSAYMFCHHGQGILYITESGQHHRDVIDELGLESQDPAEALLADLMERGIPFPSHWTDEQKLEFARAFLADLQNIMNANLSPKATIFLSDPELAMHLDLSQRAKLFRLLNENPSGQGALIRTFLDDAGVSNSRDSHWMLVGLGDLDLQIVLTFTAAQQGANFHDWYTFLHTASLMQFAGNVGQAVHHVSGWNPSIPKQPQSGPKLNPSVNSDVVPDTFVQSKPPAGQNPIPLNLQITISNKTLQHIKKHTFDGMVQQAQHLTDTQLQAKLNKTSFFPKHWTMDDVAQHVQQAFNMLTSRGITHGTHTVIVNGEAITIHMTNGNLNSAWGSHTFEVSDFR